MIEADIVGILLRRTEWRDGDMLGRLKAVEKAAKRRAKQRYADPMLEMEVAHAAKSVRKAMKAKVED